MRDLACLLVPVLCLAASPQVGHAQNVLDSYLSPGLTTFSGEQRVTTIDDMDGDGLRDLVVGNRGGVLFPNSWGEVHIIGSLTRTVVQAYAGTPQSGVIGSIVHGLPDLDGDGLPEVASAQYAGCDLIVFWSSGGPATMVAAPAPCGVSIGGTWFGKAIMAIGDEDQDGVRDLAVASNGVMAGNGIVYVVSGATGVVLREVPGGSGERFGASLEDAGDQNGDGVPDWFVGAPANSVSNGAVVVVDGATGDRLNVLVPPFGIGYGGQLVSVPDQDGDGLRDFVTSVQASQPSALFVLMVSSTGVLLTTIPPPPDSLAFGGAIAWVGDMDGDGRGELAVLDNWLGSLPSQIYLFHLGESSPQRVLIADGQDWLIANQFATNLDWNGDGRADIVLGDLEGPGILEADVRFDVLSVCFGTETDVCDGTVHGLGQVAQLSTCAVVDAERGIQFALEDLPGDVTTMIWMGPGSAAGAIQPSGLCLGGSPMRASLVSGSEVFVANLDGSAHVRMPLGSQASLPLGGWLAGSSWAFQAIYLDTTGGSSTLGWSNAIELTLP
jgi:hypothetical protein